MNQELTTFFNSFSPEVADLAMRIFKMTEAVMLPEKKRWLDHADKMITFGTERTMKGEICYIRPLKDSVNLGFFHGADLNDPKALLQGTGKMLRHIKFKPDQPFHAPDVEELLRVALREHDGRQDRAS